MSKVLARFITEESGATAIEYALLAAGIAAVITTSVSAVGCSLGSLLSQVNSQLGAM